MATPRLIVLLIQKVNQGIVMCFGCYNLSYLRINSTIFLDYSMFNKLCYFSFNTILNRLY
jgi:hypothetical protein